MWKSKIFNIYKNFSSNNNEDYKLRQRDKVMRQQLNVYIQIGWRKKIIDLQTSNTIIKKQK